MNEFRRHLPPDTSLTAMHLAFGRIWDALEAQSGGVAAAPTRTPLLGASANVIPSVVGGGGGTTVHNSLSGLQGGDIDNYYHLTLADWTGTGTGVVVRQNSPVLTGTPTIPNIPAGTISSVTIQAAINELDAEKVPITRAIITTSPLTGGGDLSADRTLTISPATTSAAGSMSASDKTKFDLWPVATREFSGFKDPELVVVTYDSTARTITLAGAVEAYWRGVAIPALVAGWVSAAHTATNGAWYLLYDGVNIVWQNTPWTFDQVMIAYVHYDATNKFAIRECHGLMQWQAHRECHETIGTYRVSGGDLSSYVVGSTTAANRRPAVAACVVKDEDLITTNPALAAAGPYTQLGLASTGTSTFTTGSAEIVSVTGAQPNWNQFSTPNWVQTPMSNNSYMSIWLVAVPATASAGSQAYRYLWVQGQTNGSLAGEQGSSFGGLNLGQIATLFTEFVPIAKIIIQYTAGNWTITQVDTLAGSRISSISTPSGTFLSSVAVTAPITGSGTGASPLAMAAATTSVPGYLTAADWTTFNGKQAALSGTGFVKSTAGTISYDTNTYALASAAVWGGITGASAQAAPAGGWTGNHGAMAVGALTAVDIQATSGTGRIASMGRYVYSGLAFVAANGSSLDLAFFRSDATTLIWSVPAGTTNSVFNGNVTSGTGQGFRNATFVGGFNPIWSFGNATAFGIGYYQAAGATPTAGKDSIGFHFGNTDAPKVWINNDGSVSMGTLTATTVQISGSTTAQGSMSLSPAGGGLTIVCKSDVTYDFQLANPGFTAAILYVPAGTKNVGVAGGIITGIYTVATLPAGVVGMRAFVSNALGPVFGAAVVGGGAVQVPVYYDGAWKVG